MATSTKRHWKLQEFAAHGANVNCASLGKKSGRVLVTGGDDKNVNLWAVGKSKCLMSLSGHTTPVECVKFSQAEDRVCGGSMSGALKIWDLEQAKIVRTLTGHKANIRCMDFHPYGEFLASGSVDTNIKLWDVRRKGCIFTYKGHKHNVNSLEFSPDGRWIASGGEDGVVKLWDLPAGKMLAEFTGHSAPVNVVHFHPHEFLLASGSSDKTVKFWDLESFQLVSTTDGDSSAIRSIYFNADGLCLYCGSQDVLRVYGWEPARIYDCEETQWGKIVDMSTTNSHLKVRPLKGETSPQGVKLTESPFQSGTPMRKSFTRRLPSLNTKNISVPMKTMEDSESSTPDIDPENDVNYFQSIKDPDDYDSIFQPRRQELARTPTKEIDSFPTVQEGPTRLSDQRSEMLKRQPQKIEPPKPEIRNPEIMKYEPQKPVSPHQDRKSSPAIEVPYKTETNQREPGQSSSYTMESTKSQSYQVKQYSSRRLVMENAQPVTEAISSFKDVMRADSEPNLALHSAPVTKSQTYQVKQQYSSKRSVMENVVQQPVTAAVPAQLKDVLRVEPEYKSILHGESTTHSPPKRLERAPDIMKIKSDIITMQEFSTDKVEKQDNIDFVPAQLHCSVGLDVDDFLPLSMKFNSSLHFGGQQLPEMSEAEAISSIIKGHDSMIQVLTNRVRNVEIIHTLWANKDLKTAIESAVHMNDLPVIVDILSNICFKPSIWNLDLCVALLPSIYELLQSKYEIYMTTGCSALRIVLKNFSGLIRSNISAPPGIGNDLAREERYNKCMSCYNHLMSIRAFILKRQTLQGKLGQSFRELHTLLQALD